MIKYTDSLDSGGKIPPQAPDFEEAVLGAILMSKDVMNELGALKPEHFYVDANQYTYQSIIDLSQANKPIDLITVTEDLKAKGHLDYVGGMFALAKLTSKISSTANTAYHASIIIQKFGLREIIRIGAMAISQGFDEASDPFELQTVIINELEKHQAQTSREPEPLIKIASETIAEIAKIQESGTKVTGIDTGFKAINKILHGWHKSDLIILAARPGAGKTALALNCANNVSKQNIPVAVFSLEMSSRQLVTRLISSETEVMGEKLKTADLQEHHWRSIHGGNFKLPMYIDDTPGLSLQEFKMKARKLKRTKKIELIVVDYLQLMSAYEKGQNREGEISKISRGLKHIAKELDIPIIALAQLSRDVEKTNRQPKLSDLRESGAIEQDADIVMFLDDPEAEQNLREGNTRPVIDVIIAKHRNGGVGLVKLMFDKTISKFKDLEQ